jgi:hypothetical protein
MVSSPYSDSLSFWQRFSRSKLESACNSLRAVIRLFFHLGHDVRYVRISLAEIVVLGL